MPVIGQSGQSAQVAKQALIETLWKEFEDTFELYGEACRNPLAKSEIQNRLKNIRTLCTVANLAQITDCFVEMMEDESCLVRLDNPNYEYFCFGDFHGSLSDIILVRNTFWRNSAEFETRHFVFLGDYVDRGIHGLEVAVYLILCKIVHPQNFTVLRGNHEFTEMNKESFLTELMLKFVERDAKRIWKSINKCFSMLPYVALIDNNVFCCHGGIPKNLYSLEEIEQVPKGIMDFEQNTLALQLTWNDFYTREERNSYRYRRPPRYFVRNWIRDTGFLAGPEAVDQFFQQFGLRFIIRAHQYNLCSRHGFYFMKVHYGAVLTVFSNSSYNPERRVSSTAYVRVSLVNQTATVYSLVQATDQKHFNQSEIFESDDMIVRLKYMDS